jgi:hypothetical protein
MEIKYPPLINVTADLKGAKLMLGKVIVDVTVKGRAATIQLDKEEARNFAAYINTALATSKV